MVYKLVSGLDAKQTCILEIYIFKGTDLENIYLM